ncbi:hypothetical protein BDF19DRAFT_415825 [Syncephalis fuscata]|nr:hypothetical protein BDF19DRAFT_415825 [Syncephalis fuscata]
MLQIKYFKSIKAKHSKRLSVFCIGMSIVLTIGLLIIKRRQIRYNGRLTLSGVSHYMCLYKYCGGAFENVYKIIGGVALLKPKCHISGQVIAMRLGEKERFFQTSMVLLLGTVPVHALI